MTAWKIETPNDYFARSAPRDYAGSVGTALLRELAANAVDAKATEVRFQFTGNRLIVRDNGQGCSAHRVERGLLNLLGSEKEPESIGGFGRAKELIYFSNPAWRIRTQDVEVVGNYLTVANFRRDLPYQQGFEAEIHLPEGLYVAANRTALSFLDSSHVTGVRWFLNGDEHVPEVRTGKRAVKDFGFARAYVQRDVDDSKVYLRTSGLLTGLRWGHHGRDVGRVVLEVTGKSWEVLTPSRDWFARDDHRREVEGWLNQLVVNSRQTLADEVGDEVLFEDFEPLPTEPAPVEIAARLSTTEVVPAVAGVRAEVSFRASHVTQSGAPAEGAAPAPVERLVAPARPAATKRRDGFDMTLVPHLPGVPRVVVHTGGRKQATAAMRWLRKHREHVAVTLAAWATAVRVVAARNKLPLDAVGFTFASDAEAEFVRVKGRFGMLVNPMKFDRKADDAADELLDRALHEATHLLAPEHNDVFVGQEMLLRRKVRGHAPRGAVARSLRLGEVVTAEE